MRTSCVVSCHHRVRRRKRTARSRHRCDAWAGSEDGSSDPGRPDMTQSLSESGAGSPQSFVFKPIASFSTLEGLPTRKQLLGQFGFPSGQPRSLDHARRALEAHHWIPPVSPPTMAAPRTTTPTQLPTVVLETAAPATPPPAPTPKRYDTVDRPRVVLTTSPEVRKLQTLFRSACHDSPRLVPGARSPASFSSLSPRSPRPGRESPTRRSPRRRPRSRGGPEGCSSPLFGRPSPRRSPLLSTPPPTQPLSSPRGLGR